MREKTILPFQKDPSQEGTAREARRKRKREQARGIEQAREYLKSPAPRTLTPQAVYHWDREDQIKALVTARQDAPDVGFMARLLALCTLPRTNPGDRKEYKRVNGPVRVVSDRRRRDEVALRHPATFTPGLDLHGGGSDAKPRARSRRVALGVHAEVGHRSVGWWETRRPDATAEPDATVIQGDGATHAPGHARQSRGHESDRQRSDAVVGSRPRG